MIDYEYPKELQEEYLVLLKKALKGGDPYTTFTKREFSMIIFFQRNAYTPAFNFVPEKYKKQLAYEQPAKNKK